MSRLDKGMWTLAGVVVAVVLALIAAGRWTGNVEAKTEATQVRVGVVEERVDRLENKIDELPNKTADAVIDKLTGERPKR